MVPCLGCLRVRWWWLGLGILLATTGSSEEVQYPLSVAVTAQGKEVFLADRRLPGVWRLAEQNLQAYFTASKTYRTPLNAVRCVAVDQQGRLLAGDSATRDVYRFDKPADPTPLTRKNPQVPYGEIGIPMDIAVSAAGEIYVSDLELHRIVRIPADGGLVKEFAQVAAPRGICLDRDEMLWVVSGRRLVKLSQTGAATTIVEDGVLDFPHCVAVGPDGTAYVSDGYGKCIWKIVAGEKPTKLISGPPLVNPVGLRWAADKLYVVDPQAKSFWSLPLDEPKLTPLLPTPVKE